MSYRYFKVGKCVFLKVKEKISLLRLGSLPKLAMRYCGPFKVSKKIGQVAYMLEFSRSNIVHNIFHVKLLSKYVPAPNQVIDWTMI
jgi:hypothetical protein